MKYMQVVTHRDNPDIPVHLAAIAMSDSGWVGTNNGWPLAGQPALYPKAQAIAIAYAWNSFSAKSLPNLAAVHADVQEWMNP